MFILLSFYWTNGDYNPKSYRVWSNANCWDLLFNDFYPWKVFARRFECSPWLHFNNFHTGDQLSHPIVDIVHGTYCSEKFLENKLPAYRRGFSGVDTNYVRTGGEEERRRRCRKPPVRSALVWPTWLRKSSALLNACFSQDELHQRNPGCDRLTTAYLLAKWVFDFTKMTSWLPVTPIVLLSLLKFLTCPYLLVSFWRPVIHALFSPVQAEWQHPSEGYCAIRFCVRKFFIRNLIRLIQYIYRAFGFWS